MILAVRLLALPFWLIGRLGLRGTITAVCLWTLAVTVYGIAGDWGLLTPAPAVASPGHARQPPPSPAAKTDIPAGYLTIYRAPSTARQCPGLSWTVLAGIGKVESDHGRSSAPGVRSGVNRFGCCAGPMQFNLTNGPPSTWARYRRRGDSVYDPADAIPASARLLCSAGAPKRMRRSLLAYNASTPYVNTVLAWAARYRGGGR